MSRAQDRPDRLEFGRVPEEDARGQRRQDEQEGQQARGCGSRDEGQRLGGGKAAEIDPDYLAAIGIGDRLETWRAEVAKLLSSQNGD